MQAETLQAVVTRRLSPKNDIVPVGNPLPPEIPDEWDYEKADEEFSGMVKAWRRLSVEVMGVMWVFYHKLKVQGQRSDLSQNCEKLPTWLEWLDKHGISPNTPLLDRSIGGTVL